MNSKKFALIKWLTGDEQGTFTPGVPLDWIVRFEEKKYLTEPAGTTYVVEWRSGRKPKGGWNCYDVVIVAISGIFSNSNSSIAKLHGEN